MLSNKYFLLPWLPTHFRRGVWGSIIIFIFASALWLTLTALNSPTQTAAPSEIFSSETGTIRGTVVAIDDSKTLKGVVVSLNKTISARTDANGLFVLQSVPVGIHTVHFAKQGYKNVSIGNVEVRANAETRLNAWLSPGKNEETALAPSGTKDYSSTDALATSLPAPERQYEHLVEPSLPLGGAVHGKSRGRMFEQMKMSTMPHGYSPQQAFRREDEGMNTEDYAHQADNEYALVAHHPLSTFSIDVDNASYSNVRRFLTMQQLPPNDAVRSEELINYFRYDYPQPKGNDPFSVNTEFSACPWNSKHKLIHIGLQGKEIPPASLPPSNLVFLIDVSGSMDSPDKLPLLKDAFTLLVKQLRAQDRVSIVVYAGAAGVVLPPTDGNDKQKIISALEQLHAGGSTAGGEGIKLAYYLAKQHFLKHGNNRVILATDGDFNVGVSSEGDLVRLIEKERESGVFLTILGFGMGNYKDAKMEKLADKGNGNYAYIDNLREAQKVLVGQMAGTLYTIAKDVKIQVEFNPVHVQAYRLIGYENRVLAKEDFNNDKKDAGDIGVGHNVTALYEIVPVGVEWQNPNGTPSVDALKYQRTAQTPKSSVRTDTADELMTVKIRYKEPDGAVSKLLERPIPNIDTPLQATSDNFRFSAAVAEFAMLLRNSPFKAHSSYHHALQLARGALGKDTEGYRTEFVRLVETAQMLTVGITRKQ